MNKRMKSLVTLSTLTVLTLLAAVVGFAALTAPFPTAEDQPVCVTTQVAADQEVFPEQVTISVYNASNRNGLASSTLNDLVDRGFIGAGSGNAPGDKPVKGVQIWADNAKNPAVALVKGQFRKAKVVPGSALGPGVVVVVGTGKVSLRPSGKAPISATAKSPSVICSPPGSSSTLPD
ncbi:LytR C-terminal domain-containing protein [Nocardioides gilvus]|uniref:LytR C-terminal domain-containing protein n=1 Tax=Nocardioides gilvus TaxID=1735589 RepID=UPI000D740D05|nr:LytR C-terminal domain-containing protein [Nocardioides gilvus]